MIRSILCISTTSSSYLSMDNVRGKSSPKKSPSVMACEVSALILVMSDMFTSSWSIHVFPGSSSAQSDPEMAPCHPECGPRPPPSPALQALRQACLEPGVSPGVAMYAWVTCPCKCICQLRNCLLPARPHKVGQKQSPCWPQQGPNKWLPWLPVLLGHFFPCRMGSLLLAGFSDGGEHWMMEMF